MLLPSARAASARGGGGGGGGGGARSAVLLSADQHALKRALHAKPVPGAARWRVAMQRRVNVGGLDAVLIVAEPEHWEPELPVACAAASAGDAGVD